MMEDFKFFLNSFILLEFEKIAPKDDSKQEFENNIISFVHSFEGIIRL